MSAELPITIDVDEPDEVEIAPGLLRLNLGEGRSELLSVAYGIPLDEPPRPEHARALELYSASVCDRLAALLEPNPGFRSPEHQRDFWIMIQAWARYVLDKLAAARDPEQARRNERKLAARLVRLRKDADRLQEAVTREREVIAVFKRNAVATRVLAQELRTFSAAMERIRKHRRRGRPATPSTLTEALELLAAFYQEATGKRPTIVTRERAGGRGYGALGPSLAFAQAAIAPLFPEAGSLVGDWRKVIKKCRRNRANKLLWTGVIAGGQKEVGLTHRRTDPMPSHPAFSPPFAVPPPPSRARRPHAAAFEPLLSVTDTAAHLQVSTKTIRRLLARGELGASRVGRQLRISRSELLAYLRRQLLEG